MGQFQHLTCHKGYLWFAFIVLSVTVGNVLSSPSQESRIINGTEVTWNNTRYQVSIRLESVDRNYFGSGHMCAGSLLSRNLVLTAAHCVWNDNLRRFRDPNEFSIVMGNIDRTIKSQNTLKLEVKEIILSKSYNTTTFQDDIAIMVLSPSVPATYNGYSIIDLNEDLNLPVGTKCIVTGWGLTENKTYSNKLMSVEVPLISKSECSTNYGRQSIMDGMLCAGYMAGERDACMGDSGGPLVCDNKLVGIVSFGFGCALPGYPGVYSDVAYYVNRLRKQTGLTKTLIESFMQQHGNQIDTSLIESVLPAVANSFNLTILTHSTNSSTYATNTTLSNNSTMPQSSTSQNTASASLSGSGVTLALLFLSCVLNFKY